MGIIQRAGLRSALITGLAWYGRVAEASRAAPDTRDTLIGISATGVAGRQ